VDFKVKQLEVEGRKFKLSIWVSTVVCNGVARACILSAQLREIMSSPGFALVMVWVGIQDTAGQERFRTLTSSYYRGAQGVILG
jgi:GTPase SAR1 family protein